VEFGFNGTKYELLQPKIAVFSNFRVFCLLKGVFVIKIVDLKGILTKG